MAERTITIIRDKLSGIPFAIVGSFARRELSIISRDGNTFNENSDIDVIVRMVDFRRTVVRLSEIAGSKRYRVSGYEDYDLPLPRRDDQHGYRIEIWAHAPIHVLGTYIPERDREQCVMQGGLNLLVPNN